MIIVKLHGGIGNQLFQFAIGKSLSLHYKTELLFDTTFYRVKSPSSHTFREMKLQKLGISINEASDKDINKFKKDKLTILDHLKLKLKVTGPFKNTYERHGEFLKNLDQLSNNQYLDGYWQSEMYFLKFKNDILSSFQLRNPNTVLEKDRSVFIHFRRGDYVTDLSASSFHGKLELDYYHKAVSQMNKLVDNPVYYVFSDDIKWTKENFSIDGEHHFQSNKRFNEIEEFSMMAYCDHAIVANSSFSWWAAWLIKNPLKNIIAPHQWFISVKNKDYYIPPNWIRV